MRRSEPHPEFTDETCLVLPVGCSDAAFAFRKAVEDVVFDNLSTINCPNNEVAKAIDKLVESFIRASRFVASLSMCHIRANQRAGNTSTRRLKGL